MYSTSVRVSWDQICLITELPSVPHDIIISKHCKLLHIWQVLGRNLSLRRPNSQTGASRTTSTLLLTVHACRTCTRVHSMSHPQQFTLHFLCVCVRVFKTSHLTSCFTVSLSQKQERNHSGTFHFFFSTCSNGLKALPHLFLLKGHNIPVLLGEQNCLNLL